MKHLARSYALLIRLLLHHRNPRYTAGEWPWYILMMVSAMEMLVVVGLLSRWLSHYAPPVAAGSGQSSLVGGALVVSLFGLLLAGNHWLMFRSRYVRALVLPHISKGRYHVRVLAFAGGCVALFWLLTSWDRLFA